LKVLVLGASGMIGSTMFSVISEQSKYEVLGTVRDDRIKRFFPATIASNLVTNLDVQKHEDLVNILNEIRPNVVINCVGLTKH